MSLRKREEHERSDEQRDALRRLVERPLLELIPLRDVLQRVAALPDGAATTVTASPTHGIEATVELCEQLVARGHEATPHLAAHMFRDRTHLADVLDRCRDLGLRSAFVIGGDAKDRGEFHDGLFLLRAMEELGHPFTTLGVAGYPEGHPAIPEERLIAALVDKQEHATYVTTQMTFDGGAIRSWIGRIRAAGVRLPIHVGAPGAVRLRRLLRVAARIGVGGSLRYLRKNRQILQLIVPRTYTADRMLRSLGASLIDPAADIRALHLFTFNQVEETVGWQRWLLRELDD
ncbi:MAG TPA: methylenetetrahydrofolate reductase [Actinomycetota bacterium]|nr:methylenetetrahydrofolate reductase [Actinomycetota bacterium]